MIILMLQNNYPTTICVLRYYQNRFKTKGENNLKITFAFNKYFKKNYFTIVNL